MTDDTDRLDAIGEYGLCVATHDTLSHTGWTRVWVVQHGESIVMGPTIREAIDGMLLELQTKGHIKH